MNERTPRTRGDDAGFLRRVNSVLIGLALAVLAQAAHAAPGDSRYRAAAETLTVSAADVGPIYEVALRFYTPPRNQSRWLDLHRLPATPGDTTSPPLDHALAEWLVTRLGDRFCLLEEPNTCRRNNGAQLEVSPIYASSHDRVRVVVACRLVFQYAGLMNNGAQAFVLERTPRGWRVVDRHGVGGER